MAGCSGGAEGRNLELLPASGTVSLNGEPAEGVVLTFLPKDSTPGGGGWAKSDVSGKFVAMSYEGENQEGLPAGTYLVQFSRLRMPDGSEIPEGKNAADVGAVETLPANLSNPNPEFSQYLLTIPTTGEIQYDLKAKLPGGA